MEINQGNVGRGPGSNTAFLTTFYVNWLNTLTPEVWKILPREESLVTKIYKYLACLKSWQNTFLSNPAKKTNVPILRQSETEHQMVHIRIKRLCAQPPNLCMAMNAC